ncbi:hypothetical protein SAMN04490356_5962 [Streptomyces melanosporofaciens]|uniref:Uncharacterized protein n=1 Tax=Streptomyces melanosporofaciens TaxID=67327 RepID=A0A1H4W7Z7_STRMJ|nr:hypothetical protein SAMN04490356_5962 [Streptomyces melanosporofaciens]
MRHRRQPPAMRAGPLAFRAVRIGLLLCVVPALLVLTVWLSFVSTPDS